MAFPQQFTLKLMRGDSTSWGFRLQGGKDFALPLSVVKVNPNSLADEAGLQVGDLIVRIGDTNADIMRHKEAQEAIYRAGNNLDIVVQRGEISTWRPSVTPVEYMPTADQTIYTQTSLKKPQQNTRAIGSGHNTNAKPFGSNIPALVHKQYNSPVNLYSEKNIAETLEAHTEVLTSGAKGINFMRPDAPINKESAVYQMVREEELRKAKGECASTSVSPDIKSIETSVTRHVEAPVEKPASERQEKINQNICAECERLIVGVFVRVKDKSLHAECFRCTTCGTSLKNMGYFTINDKLYCEIHAKQMASFMNGSGNILPVPHTQINNTIASNPSSAAITAPTISITARHSTPNVGRVPYQSTQGVSQHNLPLNPQHSTPAPPYSSVPTPLVALNTSSKPNSTASATALHANTPQTDGQSDGYRPFTGRPKYNWPPPQTTGPSGHNSYALLNKLGPHMREPIRRQSKERPHSLYSSFPFSSLSFADQNIAPNFSTFPPNGTPFIANYTTSFSQHSTTHHKVPPPTAPKPQFNAQSWTTGSSHLSTPGSRLGPRRGRGLLKPAITGTSIPICGTCGTPIRGPFILALNKTWCPNHFTCSNSHCKRSLEDIGFVEEKGKLYCEHCYEAYLAPTCAKCSQRVKGDCLNALDRQWHPECFSCAYCRQPFGNSSFYLEDGLPYCEKDWNELFTTKCVGCGYAIEAGDRWVEAMNQNYHSNCFMCTLCHKNLEGQTFYARNGRPICKSHAR